MTEERTARLKGAVANRQRGLAVVLENVFDPHNIAAVMRTCDAVGVQDVYVLNTRISQRKTWGFKSSSSAARWLSIHQFDNTEACCEVLKNRYEKVYAACLSDTAVGLYEMNLTRDIALVFGNEQLGVSDELSKMVDGSFIIPQVGVTKSLNISVACAVTLYEAYRQKLAAGHYNGSEISSDFKMELLELWEQPGRARTFDRRSKDL